MPSADPAATAAPRPHGGRSWSIPLADVDGIDLALRLTVLTLLLRPVGSPVVRVAILGLAALALAIPPCVRQPALWAALAALAGYRVLADWSLADNHAYLLAYWCLAIALALAARDTGACIAQNARLLIGWAFAFAVLWKVVLSPDYLDGRFFRVALLTDTRFADFARLAGGLGGDQLTALQAFVRGDPAAAGATIPTRLAVVGRVATVWTVAIEAAVAAAYLSPAGRGLSAMRDALLVVFCLTTYAVATVAGFGWLLLSMGVAQCERRRFTRLAYLVAYGVLVAYDRLPLMRWGLEWFAP